MVLQPNLYLCEFHLAYLLCLAIYRRFILRFWRHRFRIFRIGSCHSHGHDVLQFLS